MISSGALADAVSVTASRLNVRTSPSTSGKAVAVVSRGDTLKYVSQSGSWICVMVNGKLGYVLSEYVSVDQAAIPADVASAQTLWPQSRAGVATARVNMRSLPMTGAAIVKVIDRGESIALTGECGGWYVAQFDGKTGYVMKEYVTEGGSSTSPTPTQAPAAPDYSSPVSGRAMARVNMRAEASTKSKVIQIVPLGAQVSVTGEEGDFYRATYAGKTGYLSKQYVTVTNAAPDTPKESAETTFSAPLVATVNTRVNMRAKDSTSSTILTVMPVGASVTVTGEKGSWYRVSYNNSNGYVYKQYLTLTGQQSSVTPAPTSTPAPNKPQDSASSPETLYAGSVAGVANARVNMRSDASASSSIVKVIGVNDSLMAIGEKGDWYKVSYQGSTGYVAKLYVTITGNMSDATYQSFTGVTNAQVNLRKAPDGQVIYVIPAGAQVRVTGENGSWYVVNYGGSTGYVAQGYIERVDGSTATATPTPGSAATATPAPSVTATPAPGGSAKTGYVSGATVNLRSGPGTGYGVVGVVRQGDAISVISQSGDWYQVTSGGLSGYISSKFVSFTQVDPGATPAPSTVSKVVNSDWWTGDIAKTFRVGMTGTVTDVDTGLSFTVKRTGGVNHLDAQPLTAADTAIMYRIYGYKWQWTRRAIWVTVNGTTYAASMNGMPHGDSDSMPDNNFDGCFCIHFLNSRTHSGNRLDAAHQAAVAKAYRAGNK